MSNATRIAVFMLTLLVILSVSQAEEDRKERISTVSTTKTKATIEGVYGGDGELGLRIGKDNAVKPLEWVGTSKDQRLFTATVEYGKIVPQGKNQFIEGIIFKIKHKTGSATSNIGFDQNHPILSGTVRFRSGKDNKQGKLPIEQDGSKVTIADIVHDDGSTEPVTVFLRPR